MSENHTHYPALDGVRGMAVLIVIGAHTQPQVFPGGNIGVDLFFVLSGFLITTLLLNEQKATGSISIKNFYLRRMCRLLPALVLLLISVNAYLWFLEPAILPAVLASSKAVIFYYWNWYLSLGWQPRFDWLGHLWSLSVEEQFYVFWPIVLILTISRPTAFKLILLVGIIGPTIGRLLLWKEGPSLDLYFRTDLRFDSLMWGALAAWISFNRATIPLFKVMGGCSLVAFVVLSRFNLLSNGFLYLGGYCLIGAMGLYLMIAGTHSEPRWLKSALEFRPLRWTGKISYGLYIWHVPVFCAVANYEMSLLSRNVISIGITFAIATASYYGMEIWFLRLKPYSKSKLTQFVDTRAAYLVPRADQRSVIADDNQLTACGG